MPQPYESRDMNEKNIEGRCGACHAVLPNETHEIKNLPDHRTKVYCPVKEQWDFVKPTPRDE